MKISCIAILVFVCLVPSNGKAQNISDARFSMSAKTLKEMCIKDDLLCKSWILGVMEGMEFTKFFESSSENESGIFCYADNNISSAVNSIHDEFIQNMDSKEYNDMPERPAIFAISPSLSKYLCR